MYYKEMKENDEKKPCQKLITIRLLLLIFLNNVEFPQWLKVSFFHSHKISHIWFCHLLSFLDHSSNLAFRRQLVLPCIICHNCMEWKIQSLVMFFSKRSLFQERCLGIVELLLNTVMMYGLQIFWICFDRNLM